MAYRISIYLKPSLTEKDAVEIADEIIDKMLPDYEDCFSAKDVKIGRKILRTIRQTFELVYRED